MSLRKKIRNKDILDLISLGQTCEAVGGLFGISKQRVNQIVWSDGIQKATKLGFGPAINGWHKDGYTDKEIVCALHLPSGPCHILRGDGK